MSEQKIEEVVEKEETEEVQEPEIDEKDAKIEELSAKVEELEGKVNILKNEYARAYADTENMKKRLQNQFEQSNKYRIQSFALEILPVIDNCERALAVPTEDENYHDGQLQCDR